MENFLDHMFITFLFGAVIGLVIGTWVFIGEKLIKKFGLEDKIIAFIEEDEEE